MKKVLVAIVSLAVLASCSSNQGISLVDLMPTDQTNVNYPSNVSPLLPSQLIKLPTGSIEPQGWLLTQLENQKNGLNGHLGEISAWLQKGDNAWLTAGGKWGWEEVPYWIRGYASLTYALKDETMFQEVKFWIDAILNSQREDGNFGPVVRDVWANNTQDLWPNMLALWILQDYYEYTNDERVLPFMTKYFQYQMSLPDDQLFEGYWENSRAGDNIWSAIWLYNRTKDESLIPLIHKLYANMADWTSQVMPNWHNVNIAQSFRAPAEYYLLSKDPAHLEGSYNVQSLVRREFGQVPGGMFGGDENCRPGFFDPRQGTETCAFAEQMASDEIMFLITGDQMWVENCEDVAFNSYPAAFLPNMKALRYITSPNQTISDSRNHNPGIQNAGAFMCMNPFSSRCCQHNHGFAWPYYNEFLVLATGDNGAAVALYNECDASMKVADGKEITLEERTHYPFDTKVSLTVKCAEKVSFPLYLRIPSWCKKASAKVCGKSAGKLLSGKYLRIEREWSDGDVVELDFPMEISTRIWDVNKHSVSVDYGPLTLSLLIGEEYRKIDSFGDNMMSDSKWQEGADVKAWPSYDVLPTTDWNYALDVNAPITIEKRVWPEDNNPFTNDNAPIRFKAKGRLVPEWQIDQYGLTSPLPYEHAVKSDRLDDIILVPMGGARLRISAFPTCGQ